MFVYTLFLLHKKSSVDSDVMYKNQGASFGSNTFYKIVQIKKITTITYKVHIYKLYNKVLLHIRRQKANKALLVSDFMITVT